MRQMAAAAVLLAVSLPEHKKMPNRQPWGGQPG